MDKRLQIAYDFAGNKVVVLPGTIFKNKQNIDWNAVEKYLKKYVGQIVIITESKDRVYIGAAFPDEYKGSKYTKQLKGSNAKVKANAAQGIIEMLEIATEKRFRENHKEKHFQNAENGKMYLYDLVDIKREARTPLTIR